jgi:hypothetical protein
MELPLGLRNVEALMEKMGFLRTESMEEKLEQMKFWKIMVQNEIDEAKEKRDKIVRNGGVIKE